MKPSRSNPVTPTSRWMAAARARETERDDGLFRDPLAAELAGDEGFGWLEQMDSTTASSDGSGTYAVIRTRYFDDFLLGACRESGARQVVLVAAGLDTRAFRLGWPDGVKVFELDLPEVLDHKQSIIETAGVTPNCERITVRKDLKEDDWPDALVSSGYDVREPSVWLIEGLLFYLTRKSVHELIHRVGGLAAPGSSLGLDMMNWNLMFSPVTWPQLGALANRGARGRFGTNMPEDFMRDHGWVASAIQPGDKGANYGRLPTPTSRNLPGIPRSFFVTATRNSISK